jgi:hypothetical protein
MKLWLLTQNTNNSYDTYDSVVVAAKTEELARLETPRGPEYPEDLAWVAPEFVTVECIGTAKPGTKAGAVLASFNAG